MSIPRTLVLFTVYFAAGGTNTLSIPLTGLLPAAIRGPFQDGGPDYGG
jgi:hypothetical protein